jgi:hypothetical protein
MSVAATTWVWGDSKAQGADLLVLLALADYADEHGNCYASWAKLQSKTRLSRSTVIRSLRRLQESEQLEEIKKGFRRTAGDGVQATVWRIAGIGVSATPVSGRQVSERHPSGVSATPKWCLSDTSTIRTYKNNTLGDTPATPSPSHPLKKDVAATGAPESKPRKAKVPVEVVGPDSLPLPHSGSGFHKWWGEFCEFRTGKIRGRNNPMTLRAAKIILDELATVNEWQAVEAIKTAIACAYVKPYTDKYRDKRGGVHNPQPLPQQTSGPSALERSLERARMEVAA